MSHLAPAYIRRKRFEAKLLAIELAPLFGAAPSTEPPPRPAASREPTHAGHAPAAQTGVTTTGKSYTVVPIDTLIEHMASRTA